MPKISPIWSFFEKLSPDLAKCKDCERVLKTKKGCTSSMIGHLRSTHRDEYLEYDRKCNEGRRGERDSESDSDSDAGPTPKRARVVFTPGSQPNRVVGGAAGAGPSRATQNREVGGAGVAGPSRATQSQPVEGLSSSTPSRSRMMDRNHVDNIKIVTSVTKWVVATSQPFKVVDSDWFKKMLSISSKGRYNPVSGRSLSRSRVPELHAFVKEAIQTRFDRVKGALDGIAFTTDIWTSINNISFQSLTCHYIDAKFNLVRFLVRLEGYPGAHTGEGIAAKLDSLVGSLGLNPSTLTWCTTDGGTNVVKAMSKSLRLNTGLRCVDHRLHLVVIKALSLVDAWAVIASRLNKLVGHFNHSAKATSILKKIAVEMKASRTTLVQNVVTRWNSDLKQIQSVVDLYDCLVRMSEGDSSLGSLIPSRDDLAYMRGVCALLEPFELFSNLASSDKGPTLHHVVHQVASIKKKLQMVIERRRMLFTYEVDAVARELLLQLDRRFPEGGTACIEFATAHFLDPRFKGIGLEPYGRYEETKASVVEGMLQLVRGDDTERTPSPPASESLVESDDDDEAFDSLLRAKYGRNPTRPSVLSRSVLETNCEMDMYCQDAVLPKDADVLSFWRNQRKKFPIMARLARKFFCIPAASSTSERVFSTAGNIISPRRTCLGVDNIEMLVYLKENLPMLEADSTVVWPGSE